MSAAAGLPPLPRARARRHLAVQPSEVDLFVSQGKSSGQDLEHAISFTNCTNTRQTRQPPECSESHECARLVPYGSTYSTQSAVHNPLCAWSLEWIHVAGTTWKAGRRGGTFEERGCAKSRLTTGSPPPPSPCSGSRRLRFYESRSPCSGGARYRASEWWSSQPSPCPPGEGEGEGKG